MGLSLGPCHKPRIMQRFYRRGFQFLNVLGFFKYTKHLLEVGNSSQAFMFSAHETGIIITFPPSSAMPAMTLCILIISSGILCPGAALLLVSTKKSTATGDENAFLARSRNFLCTAHARHGGKIAFGRWGSTYFCDICPIRHI